MNSRPAHRTYSTRPTSRYAPPPTEPEGDGVGMKIGGWVLIALAVWQLVQRFVLSFWLEFDESNSKVFGTAAFEALLGVAMLQGSELARRFVLVISALVTLVLVVGLVGLSYTDFWHLWPLPAAALAAIVGIFLLNWSRETGALRIALGIILVAAGWIGSVVSAIVLVGSVDIATIKLIREWSSPERTFKSEDVELSVATPWVALKPGSPLRYSDTALLSMAHTEVISFSQIFRETRSFSSSDNLEYYLDELAKLRAVDHPNLQTGSTVDTQVGGAPARRLKVHWGSEDDQKAVVAFLTAWRDADVFYHFYLFGPAILTKKLEAEVQKFEHSIRFAGSRTLFLRDTAPKIRTACPLLTDPVVLQLSRVIPVDSPSEVYCREAYRLAVRGQASLNVDSRERLRTLMQQLFQAIPKAQIGPFGSYVTRLGERGPTSPAEDLQLTEAIRVAVESMPPTVQDDLRSIFSTAIDVGAIGTGH
jgi:hypothetical protein